MGALRDRGQVAHLSLGAKDPHHLPLRCHPSRWWRRPQVWTFEPKIHPHLCRIGTQNANRAVRIFALKDQEVSAPESDGPPGGAPFCNPRPTPQRPMVQRELPLPDARPGSTDPYVPTCANRGPLKGSPNRQNGESDVKKHRAFLWGRGCYILPNQRGRRPP